MSEYHKIQTVYKRDPATNHKTLLEGKFSDPAFEYLKDNPWAFTEKVDGTNIRIIVGGPDAETPIRIGGKTDNADIPSVLLNTLNDVFIGGREQLQEMFEDGAVLYGEGYGGKIQKGSKYRPDQNFVLFDVRVGDWWLEREAVKEIAAHLCIEIVPDMGTGTLSEMVEITREGFNSRWGDFEAEGIVARPSVTMFARNGKRIITKIKCKDF